MDFDSFKIEGTAGVKKIFFPKHGFGVIPPWTDMYEGQIHDTLFEAISRVEEDIQQRNFVFFQNVCGSI